MRRLARDLTAHLSPRRNSPVNIPASSYILPRLQPLCTQRFAIHSQQIELQKLRVGEDGIWPAGLLKVTTSWCHSSDRLTYQASCMRLVLKEPLNPLPCSYRKRCSGIQIEARAPSQRDGAVHCQGVSSAPKWHRYCNGINVGKPGPSRTAVALRPKKRLIRRQELEAFGVLCRVVDLQLVQKPGALVGRVCQQKRSADGAAQKRADASHIGQVGVHQVRPDGIDMNRIGAVQRRQIHRAPRGFRQLLKNRPGKPAVFQARQQRVGQREHADAELVPAIVGLLEVAHEAEGVGQAGHRRLGKAGAIRQVSVRKDGRSGRERSQDLHPAREVVGELAVGGDSHGSQFLKTLR